jgi:adenylate cyclase
VAGIVYGCRNRYARHRGGITIGELDAQLIQLLGSTVAVGLARLEQEAEASRMRVQFEQFFSADLARELRANPRLLEGQERVLTVLFSDIRGFSRLSEKLGPTDTCKLVAAVMEQLTKRVREHDGVVVDYSGDGIMAMWNAPMNQPDHASKACRAALAMLADLPGMDAQWHQRLQEPLKLGIGLNTGPALCGNTGSSAKFKYGPLGHAVNVASRVEGATKHFGTPLLITGSTRKELGPEFACRRLRKVRVVNIKEPIDLYELAPAEVATPEWLDRTTAYEKALGLYEEHSFGEACQALFTLLASQGVEYHDVPTLSLLAQAVADLKAPPELPEFDGVEDLASK